MKKEKITRAFPKPQLSLICPPKMFYHLSPQQILTQHLKQSQYEQINKHHSQNLKQLGMAKKSQPLTSMDWFKGSQHSHKQHFRKQTDDNLIELRTQSFVKRRDQKSKQQHRRFICKNSPYLKNKQQYERMMNNLRPIKGPTDSLIRQIKKHNDQNRKNAQNVLLATKDSFKEKIMKYSSRIGLKSSQKIFVMNSKDVHIRQALMRNGWVESTDLSSTFFHLKWVYTDSPLDYAKLQQGQFYNHFKNNQQLTNKNLFRKNIYKNPSHLRPNFPSTFDLELNGNQQRFQFQYMKYQYFKILEYLHTYIFENHKVYYEKLIRINCLNLCCVSMKGLINFMGDKNKQKQLVRALEIKSSDRQVKELRQLLYNFCFSLTEIGQNQENNSKKYTLITINNQLNSILKPIKQNIKKLQIEILEEGLEMKDENRIKDSLQKILIQDRFLLFLIVYLHRKLRTKYQGSFGTENWWIIKPAGVSRGTGIKIQRDYGKIVSSKYGKVVQKYIQRPLLLSCGRKFDIRQWVLVRSFLPLEAYIFKNCYCRFSAQKYDAQSFRSLSVHLTNYSKQKQSFLKTGTTLESIKCQQQFHKEIDEQTYKGKWLQIKSQIKQQIIKSLKCCEYDVEDKTQCFEVFGFDIILDENYRPWVLEVNLSPACENRAEFLDQYLRDMANGVVDLVQEREIRNWDRLVVPQNFPQKMLKNKSKSRINQQEATRIIQKFFRKSLKQKPQQNNPPNYQQQLKPKQQLVVQNIQLSI